MSLLHQQAPDVIEDDAALGEELTKGTSHVVLATIIAAILVTLAIGFYVWMGQKPPVATAELLEIWAHPRHVTTSGVDAYGEAMAQQNIDQVMLFAHIRVKNHSASPLQLEDVLADLTQADGILSVSAGSTVQYNEAFMVFPELIALKGTALSPHTVIPPGQTVDGTLFWNFLMNKKQWDARKQLSLTLHFEYQPSLQLTPPSVVAEK